MEKIETKETAYILDGWLSLYLNRKSDYKSELKWDSADGGKLQDVVVAVQCGEKDRLEISHTHNNFCCDLQ